LQSFIDEGLWDEARVIKNQGLITGDGLRSPVLEKAILAASDELYSDRIETYFPSTNYD
jgi:diaminohydroxyphosphoribosylaminopyrimidine deaminase/5-amino-6-(5-phosphoribosylamino)uracil reductase